MKRDMRLSMLLKIVNNVFERRLNSEIVQIELTASQCDVLGFIQHHSKYKKINPIDIERRFNLKRPTVTGILKRLEEKKFIEMTIDPDDKRYKQISLTEKSREVHEAMMKNLYEQEQILYQGITDEDKEELRRILTIMLKNMCDK